MMCIPIVVVCEQACVEVIRKEFVSATSGSHTNLDQAIHGLMATDVPPASAEYALHDEIEALEARLEEARSRLKSIRLHDRSNADKASSITRECIQPASPLATS